MKRKIEHILTKWNGQTKPLPLMLLGARQTGKTYILEDFCKKNFENYVYLNFFENADFATFFQSSLNANAILNNIKLYFGKEINVENTVFFFDEIQECEQAIASLKFFAESELPFKIVTAGSLLGVKLNRMKSPFPVGKVQIETLYPMDFEEFLWATGEKLLADNIREHFLTNQAFPEIIHKKAIELYKNYLYIGGMPASVKDFAEKNRNLLLADNSIKDNILTGYLADMTKYAENIDAVKTHQIYRTMPAQLAKPQTKFMYKIVEKGSNAEKYQTAIEWLLEANMLLRCNLINNVQSPLSAFVVENFFKLYLSDVGLLIALAKIKYSEIMLPDNNIFLGFLTENFVAQAFTANNIPLRYWNSGNKAEIDIVANLNDGIIPVEIKSGRNVGSKSLGVYVEKFKPPYSIRISAKNFGFENNIKSVPLYAVFCVE
ncbi:MAG: AAA family ATPase [Prevotellaceae bacterium]|jgi:predicted AAA+ superfamily ATPase|nr:AAA family ATPase [Prevotellaceae bacterium]